MGGLQGNLVFVFVLGEKASRGPKPLDSWKLASVEAEHVLPAVSVSPVLRYSALRTPHVVQASMYMFIQLLMDPESGELMFFLVPGCKFGLKAAVIAFNRTPEFSVHVARALPCVCHFAFLR